MHPKPVLAGGGRSSAALVALVGGEEAGPAPTR
jgi:hypothetical protein